MTDLQFNTNGSTNAADIASARVFYTGSSTTFSTTNQFGSDVSAPSGAFNVTGTQSLGAGSNYFWLVYDINCAATVSNVVDAECTSVTVAGTPYTPTVSAPTGTRTINALSTATQSSSSSVAAGTGNAQIIRIPITFPTQCYSGADALTSLDLTTGAGTTNPADISAAKVFYTGTSTTFSTTTQFGSTVNTPSGAFSVNGNQALVAGTNYFWVVYDVDCAATVGNTLDAEATGFTVGSYNHTFSGTTGNPSGTRAITAFSATVTQSSSASVGAGAVNAQIIRVLVPYPSACYGSSTDLTALDLTTGAGTTNPADIASAKVFYTGTSTTFSTTTQFGSTFANPNGAFTINGTQALVSGNNYFWIVYDLQCGATNGNTVDAEAVSFTVGSYTYTYGGSAGNPTGTRTITGLTSFTTAAAGNWSNPATWACGVPPAGTTTLVEIFHNVTLDGDVNVNDSIFIKNGGTLNVGANTLTLGDLGSNDGGNDILLVETGGTLTQTGGTIKVNGHVKFNSTSTWNMSGGELIIDGNGTGGTITTTTYYNLHILTSQVTWSGGTVTLVDPSASTSTSYYAFYFVPTPSAPVTTTGGTLRLGDGISTTSGGSTNGFRMHTGSSTSAKFYLWDVEINGSFGSNRHTTNLYEIIAQNKLTIAADAQLGPLSDDVFIYKNLENNGTFVQSSTTYYLGLSQYGSTANTAPATAGPISITGNGVYQDAQSSPTANMKNLYVNTTQSGNIVLPSNFYQTGGGSSVSNNFKIERGVLQLQSPSDVFTVGTSATVTTNTYVVNNGGRIAGALQRWFGTNNSANIRHFDVGNTTTTRRLSYQTAADNASGSASGTMTVQYFDGDPGTTGLPINFGGIDIEFVSPTGYWNMEVDNGFTLGSTTYSTTVDASDFTKVDGVSPITNLANIRLIKRPTGGSWDTEGTATAPASLASVSGSQFSTFSDFAVGGAALALPIELSAFEAKALDKTNLIEWRTQTERNVLALVVERSANGVNGWTEIGRSQPHNDAVPHQYSLEDKQPLKVSYYRLRSVDVDGAEMFSPVVVVARKTGSFNISAVFPTPATDVLTVDFEATADDNISMQVFSLDGRLAFELSSAAVKGLNRQTIQLQTLAAGMYTLRLSNESGELSAPVKFVKQ